MPSEESKPRGFSIRSARVEDAAAIEAVRHESWQATYGRHLPADAFDTIDRGAVRGRIAARLAAGLDQNLIAEESPTGGGTPAVTAFVTFGVCRDDDCPAAGEVYSLYARPTSWSTGQGRALLAAAVAALPMRPLLLWVLVDNPQARRFYEIAGWRPDGTEKPARLLSGVTLPEMRYRLD